MLGKYMIVHTCHRVIGTVCAEVCESETFFQFCCSVGSGGHIPGQFCNPDEQVRLNTPSDRKLHAAHQQTTGTFDKATICCLHNIINGEVHEQ